MLAAPVHETNGVAIKWQGKRNNRPEEHLPSTKPGSNRRSPHGVPANPTRRYARQQ